MPGSRPVDFNLAKDTTTAIADQGTKNPALKQVLLSGGRSAKGRELPSEPGTRRCTDSGLSHGELLRKEDLKSGDSGVAILSNPTWTAGRDFAIENGRNAGG